MTWTMLKQKNLLLLLCILHSVAGYLTPEITTSQGDLILKASPGRNIRFATSKVYINDINIMDFMVNSSNGNAMDEDFDTKKQLNGEDGIIKRLVNLEKSLSSLQPTSENISRLWSEVNKLTSDVYLLKKGEVSYLRDFCQSRPCQNGGTCLSIVNDYHCLCPKYWEGKSCELDVNECRNYAGTDLGCQNGATCINRPGSYECMCKQGWYGLHCTKKAKDCSGGDFEMCGHGICVTVTTGDGIKCICNPGWTNNGTDNACLIDVNECESTQGPRCSANPKVECINLPGSFKCGSCPVGYEGDGYVCYDIDECQASPNGGCSISPMVSCQNTLGSRICGPCPPGYFGDGVTCTFRGACNINHGGCHPSAKCVENLLGGHVSCECPQGMDGNGHGMSGCYILTNASSSQGCQSNPCVNGRCHQLLTGYTCICMRGYTGALCDKPINNCARNPCRNGGICRVDDSRALGFRCECTALYSGSFCQVAKRSCGGLLDAEEGSIIYPLSNNTSYNHNSRCAWVITTDENKVINVTFSKFDIEENPDCAYDFLQIHDGRTSASQLLGRFCGKALPKGGNIISSNNKLYFWFRSDETVSKAGFALHWNSIKPICGGEINASSYGRVYSPGSPGQYPPNRDCYWHLSAVRGKRILLHFFDLEIENHKNCSFDYLSIYDGQSLTDPLLNKYCNSSQPAPVKSSGSDILIHFHSDALGSGKGFQITYAPVEGVPGCGGYYSGDKGEIVSPSFNGKYLSNLICEYEIKSAPDTVIRIHIINFHLERSYRCNYDYLKIYDGPSAESRLVGKFCGTNHIKTFTSSSNSLFLKFVSDAESNKEGFKISFESFCYHRILGISGVVQSPGFPMNYTENKICEYVLSTDPGKAIVLNFIVFDLEENEHFGCLYDYVDIRDGPDENSTLVGKYCGSRIPPPLTSTHNYLYLKFVSDINIPGAGFYANFTTIDVHCGGIYRETTGVISFSQKDVDVVGPCTWLLVAPVGQYIKILWNRISYPGLLSGHCSNMIELTEIDLRNKETKIPYQCETSLPPIITTTTNRMKISIFNFAKIGFSLSYTFLDETTHCGGNFLTSNGFITSPGWPNKYESHRDCEWTITVPSGQQIKLTAEKFDLESPLQGRCTMGDFLEIRNGASENAPIIGSYCGDQFPKQLVSIGNSLRLKFHSDTYLTGDGFRIEWDGTIIGCGGTLTGATGSISSPNYPQHYPGRSECFYRIVTSPGSKLKLLFHDLDMGWFNGICRDYVEIYDGRDYNARSLGKFCTESAKTMNIETTSNFAFIKFHSAYFSGERGFLLNYFTVCENNITGSHGIIESPNFPDNNFNCTWKINVPLGNKINITFSDLNIYKMSPYSLRFYKNKVHNYPCTKDYIEIEGTDKPLGRLCGTTLPPKITSINNHIEIRLVKTFLIKQSGFRLEWVKYGCGGHIQRSSGSLIQNKVSGDSGPLECEWLIETTSGTSIVIVFQQVFMQDTHNCTIDAIEIYDGPNRQSPMLTKICHLERSMVTSNTNFMLVRLVKQSDMRDVHFASNFHETAQVCGGRIVARSGSIVSRNYPKNYYDNANCMWNIAVPWNHRVLFNVTDLDLYGNDCKDSIRLFDNSSFKANYSKIICRNSDGLQFISKSNELKVQFESDNSGTAKGFKAYFNVTCGSTIQIDVEGILASETSYPPNSTCKWNLVSVKPEQKITFTLTYISLPRSNDVQSNRHCPTSFLRILDGNDENAPLIDEFCGRQIPHTIVSRGSALTVVLGSYTGPLIGKFLAHYTTVSTACGGQLYSEEGDIASPNYPDSYPSNCNCEWTLNTSPGNRVYVLFKMLDIVYSDNCNQHYLELREKDRGGRIIGIYCGNEIPTNITSAVKLYIKFHSNNIASRQGFLLHYGFLHGNEFTELDRGEISSPLYPNKYVGKGEFTWRITTVRRLPITLNIDKLEIRVSGTECYNSLSIYDGYDDQAPVLNRLCGLVTETQEIHTTSNAVFIKLKLDDTNTGSVFYTRWRSVDEIPDSEGINCGSKSIRAISPGESVNFSSPNYPSEYSNNLNCEWVFKATVGRHLTITFPELLIEDISECFADYVSIYYSSSGTDKWTALKEKLCNLDANKPLKEIVTSTYIKVNFVSDSSITAKGFLGIIKSACGGPITARQGIVSMNWLDRYNQFILTCEWIIKVRPGRSVSLQFEHFNITNNDDKCTQFVKIRNGNSIESPLLKNGKFCGNADEDRINIEAQSNVVMVSYSARTIPFKNFVLQFAEKDIECGGSFILDSIHNFEIIMSPNYPSVPLPYSECTWIFTGPPGETLRVDFVERFDLQKSEDCVKDYVIVRDGSSDSFPKLGKFCDEKPGTIKSSDNRVYIKYVTQMLEPRNGFKANVSIDVCGGTIFSDHGEITSPGYPNAPILPYGTLCEWTVVGSQKRVLNLYPQDVRLKNSLFSSCLSNLTIEEPSHLNVSLDVIRIYCGDKDKDMSMIESTSNKIIIKYFVGKSSGDKKGFRFTFNSTRKTCGGYVTTPSGLITTPGFPRYTTQRFCHWSIVVPNEERTIRLEVIDSSLGHIKVYQGMLFEIEISNNSNIYQSTSNVMTIFLVMPVEKQRHRFKAKFTSDSPRQCGGKLSGKTGEILPPNLHSTYLCRWMYVYDDSNGISNNLNNTIVVHITMNDTAKTSYCPYSTPKISVTSELLNGQSMRQSTCSANKVYRIASRNMIITATNPKVFTFNFHLSWKTQPCGGLVEVGIDPINILNFPKNFSGSLDCHWVISDPNHNRVELSLQGAFKLNCDQEFLWIKRDVNSNFHFEKFCKDNPAGKMQEHFKQISIEYHTDQAGNDLKLFVNVADNKNICGGYVSKYDPIFESPNFPNSYSENQECVWNIVMETGFRISLQFIDRFVVEKQQNCSKDSVIVYDWSPSQDYIQIAKLCGRELPPVYYSTHNKMRVVLRTDGDINLDGFKAKWTPMCGTTTVATKDEQFIVSPRYPSRYMEKADCTYKIINPRDEQKIIIKFYDLDIEGPYPACTKDNLTIISKYYYDTVYCGNDLPDEETYDGDVTLKFLSDAYYNKRGFKLSFKLYSCGEKVTVPSIISSQNGDTYEDRSNCTWLIEAPKNKIIVVKFVYVETESAQDCDTDYVAVYNGLQINEDKRVALLCGRITSETTLRSSENTLIVQLVSDFALNYKGFKAEITFQYDDTVGCGGHINLTSSPTTLKSPLIGGKTVYENYLDCLWTVQAPVDYVIRVEFISFHIAPCLNVNQTALGYSNCLCDFVEFKDGLNINSLTINKYCGHNLPQKIISSDNSLSVRMITDGAFVSAGFEIILRAETSVCQKQHYTISALNQHILSPNYNGGYVPRGLHCVYKFIGKHEDLSLLTHIRLINLDLLEGSADQNVCDKDKLVISNLPSSHNITKAKDFVLNSFHMDYQIDGRDFVGDDRSDEYVFCGKRSLVDIYLEGDFQISLQTSPEEYTADRKGVEFEVEYAKKCQKNYTEPQGFITNHAIYETENEVEECYTLITAPVNNTISLYFVYFDLEDYNDNSYLDVLDGDKITSNKLVRLQGFDDSTYAAFSSGRHLLIHHHRTLKDYLTYSLNYVTTAKGRGCGGKISHIYGLVTSPMYPDTYRKTSTCEWELETTLGSRLRLHFKEFDLGSICNQNFIEFVNRRGEVFSTFCSEIPADYTSDDNYLKIVFHTSPNNSGSGWVAIFAGVKKN